MFAAPVKLLTTPVAITILRILLLFVSTTYRFVPSVLRPRGRLKVAAAAAPSSAPAAPAVFGTPVKLLTAPVEITTLRILLLFASLTYRLVWVLSMVMPAGWLNVATVAVPSAAPGAPPILGVPVRLLTTPVAITILRILLLPKSAT